MDMRLTIDAAVLEDVASVAGSGSDKSRSNGKSRASGNSTIRRTNSCCRGSTSR